VRRTAIDVNIFFVVEDVLIDCGARTIGGEDRAGKWRIRTKGSTKCENRDKGDPYTFFIQFH
jgi:hypothetical protein